MCSIHRQRGDVGSFLVKAADEFFNRGLEALERMWCRTSALVRKMLCRHYLWTPQLSTIDPPHWVTLKTGWRLAPAPAAARRRVATLCDRCLPRGVIRTTAVSRYHRPLAGRPERPRPARQHQTALGGERGVHVRESIRLELPVADVYRFWRRLENLPRFMTHLDRVTEPPTADRIGWPPVLPGWPSSGTRRSSTRSRTS